MIPATMLRIATTVTNITTPALLMFAARRLTFMKNIGMNNALLIGLTHWLVLLVQLSPSIVTLVKNVFIVQSNLVRPDVYVTVR